MANIFQPILSADLIEDSIQEQIETWIETYLSEMERQRGMEAGFLQRPLSYTHLTKFSRPFLEDQLPCVAIVSPGLAEQPKGYGSGMYRAKWQVVVAAVVSAGSEDEKEVTNRNAKMYSAALRAIMVQQSPPCNGFVGTTWIDEDYTELPPHLSRSMAVTTDIFTCEFEEVVNRMRGPNAVPEDPRAEPAPVPSVQSPVPPVDVTIS